MCVWLVLNGSFLLLSTGKMNVKSLWGFVEGSGDVVYGLIELFPSYQEVKELMAAMKADKESKAIKASKADAPEKKTN